jgi:hypothetical protein
MESALEPITRIVPLLFIAFRLSRE